MQHLEWTRYGRKYTHADEGKPNTFTVTADLGEVNVDVAGDGQTFAPYVLDGTRLRHGDSECDFQEEWQTLRCLGQTLVSRSRLYVQRDVGGVWTDVPHGIPTRNVAQDYPREGRCTAYLDFPDLQGYAAGARLQVGVEVGGSDQQIYGFRFRSPVAGTFRFEWVLDVPAGPDLEWPTNGVRVGPMQIRWTPAEAAKRSATIESDGQGGRVLRIVLGPYTAAAMEWVTIYPDTWGPTSIAADADDGTKDGASWSYMGTVNENTYERVIGFSWQAPALAATVTINGCYVRGYVPVAYNAAQTLRMGMENADPATNTRWSSSHLPGYGPTGYVGLISCASRNYSLAVNQYYWGDGDTEALNLASHLQSLLTTYGDIAAGDRLNFALMASVYTAAYVFVRDSNQVTNPPQLKITYTAGGGGGAADQWFPAYPAGIGRRVILVPSGAMPGRSE